MGRGQGSDGRVQSLVIQLRHLACRVDRMLDSVLRRVEFLGRWNISLATTVAVVLMVIVIRYYYSFVTGYIVPDEAWYYNTFILDRQPVGTYRPVFLTIFLSFFHGVNDVWAFLLRGVLYSAVWTVGCVVLFFMILRRLKTPEKMASLLILSLPLFPVFIVFASAVLTETLALLMALLGVYFGLRYVQEGRIVSSLLSVIFFVLAYEVREPYLLFVVGNIVLFLGLSLKRRSLGSVVAYAILISLFFPIPVRVEPANLQFAQPVYTWIMNLIRERRYEPLALSRFDVPIRISHPDLPRAIAVGLGYGFNPLFALFTAFSVLAVSFDLFKRRSSTDLFLALNMIWSLGAFVVSAAVILQSMSSAISIWVSSIIRTSHASLPCVAGFPSLYRRLKIKRVAAMMVILLILSSTQLSSFSSAFQRSLSIEPVDRLSLDYKAPYYRMYLLAKESGKTLVFGGLHMREIRMYMAMLPNVVLVAVSWQGGGLDEAGFRALIEHGWDAIFLYDDWVSIKNAAIYPQFYAEILRSRQYPGYTVETLWTDGESYALKMVKSSDANIGSYP